jgi:hypothetical protein
MSLSQSHRTAWLVVALPGLILLAGCGGSGHARYTPTKDEARSSLEAALSAWRDGQPYGPIETVPPIRVADTLWQGGQRIESFQIGEEEDPGDGTKQFPVKLTMKKTNQVQEVRYVVNGRDPVWVFSELDYKKLIDMGNGPEIPGKRPSGGRSRRK